VVDYLNWDGAEGQEILLEVFRRAGKGYALLAQRGSSWEKVWETMPCGG
jgi:hypothetical protein